MAWQWAVGGGCGRYAARGVNGDERWCDDRLILRAIDLLPSGFPYIANWFGVCMLHAWGGLRGCRCPMLGFLSYLTICVVLPLLYFLACTYVGGSWLLSC
ncbi:hypothetical protein B0H19DRAFT_372484 [Mycena capillaripes]|nr:hypothetical protein B0H19DRAFT_372484 [Mycena capillaripes]